MPIYEYECRRCGHAFEQLLRSKRDEHAGACPECGSRQISRRLSVFAAHRAPTKQSSPPGGCGACDAPSGSCPFT